MFSPMNTQPYKQPMLHQRPVPDDDSEIPRIDLVEEFGPENPNVQINPIFSAFSIGMQQMPGGLEGMKYSMRHFMNATDKKYWNQDIDGRAIERMMFDPDERTIDRIISLMEARYDEVEELEQRLLYEHLDKLKKRHEEMLREELQRRAREDAEKGIQQNIDSDSDSDSSQPNKPQANLNNDDEDPVIEELTE